VNGVLCRDCGQDHETTHDAYLCDVRIKHRDNHIADCACNLCRRVMQYEDALHCLDMLAASPAADKGDAT